MCNKINDYFLDNNLLYKYRSSKYRIHIFVSLKIINKNIYKNTLEILDQNCISIEVTFLYFFNQSAKNIE